MISSFTVEIENLVKDPKKAKTDGRFYDKGAKVTRAKLEESGANVEALLSSGAITAGKTGDVA